LPHGWVCGPRLPARVARFESPAAAVDAGIAHRETEVVMNDALVEALRIDPVAVHRGLYRVGPRGETRRSAKPEHW
jgi:hypothetical protein